MAHLAHTTDQHDTRAARLAGRAAFTRPDLLADRDAVLSLTWNWDSRRRYLERLYRSDLARVWLPAVCLLTLLVGGMGYLLLRSQEEARVQLEERYALRGVLGSRFVASYVRDVHERETAYATSLLAGERVTAARFAQVSRTFGFDAAVLLDARGRALNVLPAKPELIGKRLDVKYAHLRAAVGGSPSVSGVVPSAARAKPIVALAVPFETPFGRRVFSGGGPVNTSPLGPYLDNTLPFAGAHAYLIDAERTVIVAGGSAAGALALPPKARGPSGAVTVAGVEYRFALQPVPGTSWRLLTLAPSAQLLAPLSGPRQWIPWLVLLAFALASTAALGLLRKLTLQRAELAHLATHDPLTGALNRRTLERSYSRLAFEAELAGAAVGVLTIDLDHFKDVNDSYGHAAGDDVLRGVAETLLTTVRPSDVVARIGGDEFVVLLASVDAQEADLVAERVVHTLAKIVLPALGVIELQARCSAGIALAGRNDSMATVLARADSALYEAKAIGRNGWRTATA